MVAVVLTLLWRQVPGVQELTRLLAREDLLSTWTEIITQICSKIILDFKKYIN